MSNFICMLFEMTRQARCKRKWHKITEAKVVPKSPTRCCINAYSVRTRGARLKLYCNDMLAKTSAVDCKESSDLCFATYCLKCNFAGDLLSSFLPPLSAQRSVPKAFYLHNSALLNTQVTIKRQKNTVIAIQPLK